MSVTRIHNELTITYANSLWILYQLLEITMDFFPFSQNHDDFIIFFVNSLWSHYKLSKYTLNSLRFSLDPLEFTFFRKFAIISLSNTRIHYEICIDYANSLLIYSIHFELTTVMRIFYRFNLSLANSLWILFLCKYTISFAKSL